MTNLTLVIRCIIFIFALGSAESKRRRGLSFDRDNHEETMVGTQMKKLGQISMLNVNDRNGGLNISRKPSTYLEKDDSITETNKTMGKKVVVPGATQSKAIQTRLGRVEHRSDSRNPNLRHHRTTRRCHGMKKIVQCKNGVAEQTCKKVLIDAGVELRSDMPNTPFFAICVGSEDKAQLVAALTEMEGVEDDPLRTLSYIPGLEGARKLKSNEQVIPYGVELVKAPAFWDRYGKRGGGVKVCVIDTGVRNSHEDLRAANISGANDSFLVTPWNQDGIGHGTHVSGTILASNNGVGVIGVAPEASIYMVRVFDSSDEFTAANLVDAMNACAHAGAKIISMSLGGSTESSAERMAVTKLKDKGILLVAAAGNDGGGSNVLDFPAGYEPVMSVAAIDKNLDIATFSSYNNRVDIAAPGVDVVSTYADSDTSYAVLSGTSMATPHISGVAALLWSQFPDKSVTDIDNAIKLSARDFGPCGQDKLFGHGIVDVMAAAAYLENGGGAATQQSGCVDVSVSLTTDDYGSETYYIIIPDNDTNKIMYRGGPYPDSKRSTYTDKIKLQAGCYDLVWLDTYGDGSNNPAYGIGAISLTYMGNKEVDYNDFGGSQVAFRFGNCNGSTNPSTPGQANSTPAPTPPTNTVPLPTEAPATAPGDYHCPSGESHIEMTLETDQWSTSENQLLFWDVAAPDNEYVWLETLGELQPNSAYDGNACLLPSHCYEFYFFDEYGDGLATGGLTLTLHGKKVFQIKAGDPGTVYEAGSPMTFWSKEFGACSSTSTSSLHYND